MLRAVTGDGCRRGERKLPVVVERVVGPGPADVPEAREQSRIVAAHEEELDRHALEHEGALVLESLGLDLVEPLEQAVDAAPVVACNQEVEIAVRPRLGETEELLGPPAEDPRLDPLVGEQRKRPLDELEIVHAAETASASSRGSRRETTC